MEVVVQPGAGHYEGVTRVDFDPVHDSNQVFSTSASEQLDDRGANAGSMRLNDGVVDNARVACDLAS